MVKAAPKKVVHNWADLQSVHGLRCYGNIPGDGGGVFKITRRIWEVGVAGWPVTGRRRGRSQHYCGGLHCGLPLVAFWQQRDCVRVTRTQNVSKYMLVLALCLVIIVNRMAVAFGARYIELGARVVTEAPHVDQCFVEINKTVDHAVVCTINPSLPTCTFRTADTTSFSDQHRPTSVKTMSVWPT